MSLDVYLTVVKETEVYSDNITHNMGEMASEVGIYKHLWRPDELGITKARSLIGPLIAGLRELKDNPKEYKRYNPKNGWGDYKCLVDFVEDYVKACIENPDATIYVSR
jgi:hypothetical protein